MLAIVVMAAAAPVGAQSACPGFDRQHTVTRWGGSPNAFSPVGVQSVADLQAYFAAHPAEIRAVLASQGLGDDVADALLAAVREGSSITERTVPRGERLQWMAYREGGQPATIDTVCVNTPGAAPAFEIVVPVTAAAAAQADCSIDVTTDCQPGGTSAFSVRTAPGARVTLAGPAGTSAVIEGGGSTWTGPVEDPYRADYTFTVTNQAAATETVTTYTFLVPKQCVNLSLVGRSQQQRAGAPVTCSERRVLAQPVCPLQAAACVIELDADEVRRGETVGYRVTGHWTDLDLAVMRDGSLLSEPVLTAEQGTLVLPRRGTYTIVGTATNEVGDTDVCRASVAVASAANWIVRGFPAFLMVDDEALTGTVAPGICPCPARTDYGYDDGFGLGVSVERLFNERVGLELRGLYGRLDDDFQIEANGVGIYYSDDVDYWDLSLGLNFHLTPNRAVDWYVGPFIGYAEVAGNKYYVVDRSLEYDADGDMVWGAQMGLDWPFGAGPWYLHLGARYTDYSVDVTQRFTDPVGTVFEQSGSIDLNPVTFELGVAYHF